MFHVKHCGFGCSTSQFQSSEFQSSEVCIFQFPKGRVFDESIRSSLKHCRFGGKGDKITESGVRRKEAGCHVFRPIIFIQ